MQAAKIRPPVDFYMKSGIGFKVYMPRHFLIAVGIYEHKKKVHLQYLHLQLPVLALLLWLVGTLTAQVLVALRIAFLQQKTVREMRH